MALLFSMTCAQAGPVFDRIKNAKTYKIGYRAAGAPFSYDGPNGKAVGYGIEVCQKIALALQKELGLDTLNIEYIPLTAGNRIEKVKNGEVDIECANTTNSKARREQVAFGLTYYYAAAKLLVRKGEGITGMDGVNGKKLAVFKGSTGEQIGEMRKRGGAPIVTVAVKDSPAAIEGLNGKQVDAVINDDVLLMTYAQQSKGALEVVGSGMSVEPLAPMLSKDDAEYIKWVQNEMARMYREQEIDALYDKWFMKELPGKGISLQIKPSRLLWDNFRRPSNYVADWVVL